MILSQIWLAEIEAKWNAPCVVRGCDGSLSVLEFTAGGRLHARQCSKCRTWACFAGSTDDENVLLLLASVKELAARVSELDDTRIELSHRLDASQRSVAQRTLSLKRLRTVASEALVAAELVSGEPRDPELDEKLKALRAELFTPGGST